MWFPKYWSKARVTVPHPRGYQQAASAWGWSDQSLDEARQTAQEKATQVADRLIRDQPVGHGYGTYGSGKRPFREEVIQSFADDQGKLSIAVTRNSYGVLVLNTSRVMFIDLDVPSYRPPRQPSFFSRLFGAKTNQPPAESPEDKVLGRLDQFLDANPDFAIRLYRTKAGFRALVTNALFDPTSEKTRSLMESLGTDRLYVRLCQQQECFRARLTPKPWRCDYSGNYIAWPQETDEQRQRFEEWLAGYTEMQSGYATCRFVGTRGRSSSVHPEAETVIEIHDRLTRCDDDLPLA